MEHLRRKDLWTKLVGQLAWAVTSIRMNGTATMKRTIKALSLTLTASLALASGAAAQNLVISNVRIIVGPGQTIEKGAVVITNGRISAVNTGAAPAPPAGVKVIDATGMTLIAGFIDAHRHIIQAGAARKPSPNG